ncbi:MAG: serine/threonine protein kinase [Planctomycetales bacterium]|nr:serine/threonine protein kinase [Planctomycetales bacterium]
MNPWQLIRRTVGRRSAANPQAHMTWAHTSVGRTVTRTGVFLKKQLWVWPIIAVVILSVIGLFVRSAIESTMKANLRSQLQTLLTAEAAMLDKWLEVHAANAETAANDPRLREQIGHLLVDEAASDEPVSRPDLSRVNSDIAKALAPIMASHDFIGYFVVDRSKEILASSHAVLIGQRDIRDYDQFLSRALDGEAVVSAPFPSVVMMQDEAGQVRTGEPTMYACAPIRDESFLIVGALALQLQPQREFTRILQLGQMGDSGETYAFDRNGRMVSNSRFDDDLILLGILPDQQLSRSILNVLIRDPGGDMTNGFRPTTRRSEMPMTRLVADAVEGRSGVDVEGYRDYRGVPVVGAWTWLPEYELGVATEIDLAEAFMPLTILRRTFWGLYGLLVVSAIAIFAFTVIVANLQREARKAAIEAQQLGQYTLETKLGAGAMGVVYKGHHSMLRRPTAIKLLDADRVNDASIQRFEREVQITCRLNHPSTIAIYDFGRTPEGVFYYAMEYLDGIDLQQLVEKYGAQPGGRVISILMQACGSLYEAHSQGLVHRDIKPANMMLSHRGGEPDVVKVLDFGLVKAVDEQKRAGVSAEGGLTGTPLYMSPEAIQSPMTVDNRSDIYGLGAVGYFLLTGRPVFDATSIVDLCQKHIDEVPERPSSRLGHNVSDELEYAILSCLEKTRAKRPQTARDFAQLLRKCPEAKQWNLEQAEAWWARHERGQSVEDGPARETTTSQPGYDQTMVFGND